MDISINSRPGEPDTQASREKTSLLLADWVEKVTKLRELEDWVRRAEEELRSIPPSDPRRKVYSDVYDAKERLKADIEKLEEKQDSALSEHLAKVGPLTLRFGDGSQCVVASQPRTAGGAADLLPADLLRVWRVAAVFEGSVVGRDAAVQRLTFGDAQQLDWFNDKKRRRK